jgi:hypothetical protein
MTASASVSFRRLSVAFQATGFQPVVVDFVTKDYVRALKEKMTSQNAEQIGISVGDAG